MKHLLPLSVLAVLLLSCNSKEKYVYQSDDLIIEKLTDNSYLHISYLETESFGRVRCNGLIIIEDGQAIVVETPTTDKVSEELIDFLKNQMNTNIKAVVPLHFHIDALGGIEAFHEQGIPSYTYEETLTIAEEKELPLPMNGYDPSMSFHLDSEIILFYPGPGHTVDNSVVYYSKDKLLFGGCLVKSLGAGKGNLEDADVEAWPSTINSIIEQFPQIEKVVPGHGEPGDSDLLQFTQDLFSNNP